MFLGTHSKMCQLGLADEQIGFKVPEAGGAQHSLHWPVEPGCGDHKEANVVTCVGWGGWHPRTGICRHYTLQI